MLTLTIPTRYNGPRSSGNGGWVSGHLAAELVTDNPDVPVRVKLLKPPPLEVPLTMKTTPDAETGAPVVGLTTATGEVIGTAQRVSTPSPESIVPVSVADARAATATFPGLADHPFPTCYVCGTQRPDNDGLGLHPGFVADGVTACVWTAPAAVVPATDSAEAQAGALAEVWAALDCPGGWSAGLTGRPMVLGTMTASVLRPVPTGAECVVMGRCDETHGRKSLTTSMVWHDSQLVAWAAAVWVVVDPAVFNRLMQ